MTTIQEIESAIVNLPKEELCRFREWFEEFETKMWDEQLESDIHSGKLGKLADKALNDYKAGKYTEL